MGCVVEVCYIFVYYKDLYYEMDDAWNAASLIAKKITTKIRPYRKIEELDESWPNNLINRLLIMTNNRAYTSYRALNSFSLTNFLNKMIKKVALITTAVGLCLKPAISL